MDFLPPLSASLVDDDRPSIESVCSAIAALLFERHCTEAIGDRELAEMENEAQEIMARDFPWLSGHGRPRVAIVPAGYLRVSWESAHVVKQVSFDGAIGRDER